jgi:ferredoxin-type protein NapH
MMSLVRKISSAVQRRRWLLVRRIIQLTIVSAFIVDLPWLGRVAAGNLSSSVWFGELPFTDPFVALQSLLAGASLALPALIGAAIIAGFYTFFGGRIYCSWVCPINMLTDAAYWVRQRLNIKGNLTLSRELRVIILLLALVLSMLGGTLAWETINPITLVQRELMWGSTAGVTLLATLFLFDVFVTRRGWCGHLCPVGAFYSLLGRYGRMRVVTTQSGKCVGCSSCIRVCPEPHVLAPVVSLEAGSVTSGDCTRCGACLDACTTGALKMKLDLGRGKSFKGIPIVSKH